MKPAPDSSAWPDRRDALGLAGLGLLGYGLWLVHPPLAFIGPGLILVAIAIFGVRS